MSDREELGPDLDFAIQRAMEAADLRGGGAPATSTVAVSGEHEPSAAEASDLGGAIDSD